MRTTLILPEELVDAARETLGFTSKTDTVVFALREIVRRKKKDELKDYITKMNFNSNTVEMRRKDRERMQRAVDRS